MIRQVREKDQNEIRSNNCERNARLAHGLTILSLTERIYPPSTEDVGNELPLPRAAGVAVISYKRPSGSSIGFVLEHRLDLITQLRGILVAMG